MNGHLVVFWNPEPKCRYTIFILKQIQHEGHSCTLINNMCMQNKLSVFVLEASLWYCFYLTNTNCSISNVFLVILNFTKDKKHHLVYKVVIALVSILRALYKARLARYTQLCWFGIVQMTLPFSECQGWKREEIIYVPNENQTKD